MLKSRKNVALTCSASLVNIRDHLLADDTEQTTLVKKSSLPDLCSPSNVTKKYLGSLEIETEKQLTDAKAKKTDQVVFSKSSQSCHISNESSDSGVLIVQLESGDAQKDFSAKFSGLESDGTLSIGPTKSITCENCGHELTKQSPNASCVESPRSNCSLFSLYNQQSSCEFCRICHCDGDRDDPLISPCKCKGSMTHVHHSCLQRWIKSSGNRYCELCGFQYVMKSKMKKLAKWQKLAMTKTERRKLCCSVFFHVVAITCVVWSLYVLIEKTASELKTGSLHWPFWTKLAVVAVGLTGGVAFMYVQCKTYFKWWKRLKIFNEVIQVQNRPLDEPQDVMNHRNSEVLSRSVISLITDNRRDHDIIQI